MNSRMVELEAVLSRSAPDRQAARRLAVDLARSLDALSARRDVDRLLRCASGLTRIGSADAADALLIAMLALVDPTGPEASRVRDQQALASVARGRRDPGAAPPRQVRRRPPSTAFGRGTPLRQVVGDFLDPVQVPDPVAVGSVAVVEQAKPSETGALELALQRNAAVLGSNHPQTCVLRLNLMCARFRIARDHGDAEEVAESLTDLRDATDRALNALGTHHPRALVAQANLASAEFELARVRRSAERARLALPSLRSAADRTATRLGTDHPHAVIATANLASAELELAHLDGARGQAQRLLDVVRDAAMRAVSALGAEHPAVAALDEQRRACEALLSGVGPDPSFERGYASFADAGRSLATAKPGAPSVRQGVSASEWPPGTLLARLRDSSRQELMSLGTTVRYGADREIIVQDATDTHVFLLLEGVVKVLVNDEGGDTAVLTVRVAGDLVGELAALDHKPRSATVITCGDVTAKPITSAELHGFLHRRNDGFVELIGVIDDQLRWANRRRRDFLSHTAAERVARVLAELVGAHGRQEVGGWVLGIPLTKVELASIAGMKPRTAEKAFADLRKAGVVVSHLRRDVVVPDLEGLRRFARM
ncbi:helix-turn-helix domain-containing protein [Saccharothrix sp. S26]|uniref:helix-turn-helix domain-containing protein n=1 Tax=Saccharothrix sp. S26 TaxID=2907215 RepID=UPI001F3AFC83|nr:helix-turn-helix domain-containing protein [Saccharothrix sp. S26]MCE6997452.1 helix-turn-helix domain-containing protein [Saccharothrix sp. S26]